MPKHPRPILIAGDVAFVPLTLGYAATIDAVDAPLVAGRNWSAQVAKKANGDIATVYARSWNVADDGKRTVTPLHRLILAPGKLVPIDHIDGDGLNNRRRNLRTATPSQNSMNRGKRTDNTSGYKGVHKCKRSGRFQAYITAKGARRHLGWFSNAEDAYASYLRASADVHGDYGRAA